MFDVARRPVTKLATPFGNEMLSQWCLSSTSPAANCCNEHFGYRQDSGSRTAPLVSAPCRHAFRASDAPFNEELGNDLSRAENANDIVLGQTFRHVMACSVALCILIFITGYWREIVR